MEILLVTILTTLVSDVYLQGYKTVKLRNNIKNINDFFIGHLKHTLQIGVSLFFVISIIFYKYISIKNILKYVVVITLIHIVVDMTKCTFGKKLKEQNAFLIDQIIHLITNIYICNNWEFPNTNIFPYIEKEVLYGALIFIIIYIYTVRCGEFFIDLFMNQNFKDVIIASEKSTKLEEAELMVAATDIGEAEIKDSEHIDKEDEVTKTEEDKKIILSPTGNDTGRYIGVLERSIVLFLVASNNYSSIALLLTGKSIARNKEFADKEFAVKFIVGTFLSIFIGILGGEIFKAVMKYFI